MLTCMHTHKHINYRSILASLPHETKAAAAAASAELGELEHQSGAGMWPSADGTVVYLRRRAAQVTNFQHAAKRRGGGRARG